MTQAVFVDNNGIRTPFGRTVIPTRDGMIFNCNHRVTEYGHNAHGMILCRLCDIKQIKMRAALANVGDVFTLGEPAAPSPRVPKIISLKFWEMRNDHQWQ